MTNWKTRYATEVVVVLALLVLTGWDIYAEASAGEGSGVTISEITLHFLWLHPALAFALGGVAGHLTWPRRTIRPLAQRIAAVVGALLVIAAVDHWHLLGSMLPVVPFCVGVPAGHLLWAQSTDTEQGIGL